MREGPMPKTGVTPRRWILPVLLALAAGPAHLPAARSTDGADATPCTERAAMLDEALVALAADRIDAVLGALADAALPHLAVDGRAVLIGPVS